MQWIKVSHSISTLPLTLSLCPSIPRPYSLVIPCPSPSPVHTADTLLSRRLLLVDSQRPWSASFSPVALMLLALPMSTVRQSRSTSPPQESSRLVMPLLRFMLTPKFPTPPPPPRQLQQHEFWLPCRSCYPEEGQWKCPQPVPRFEVPAERDRCLRADGLCPDGHRLCAGW